jgi:hypothetical protein
MSGEATSNYFQRLDSIIPKAELDILRYSEEIELHSGDKPFVKESLEIELLDNKTFLEKEANNPYYILDNGTLVRYDSRVFRVPNITTLILEDLALGKKGRYVFPNPLEYNDLTKIISHRQLLEPIKVIDQLKQNRFTLDQIREYYVSNLWISLALSWYKTFSDISYCRLHLSPHPNYGYPLVDWSTPHNWSGNIYRCVLNQGYNGLSGFSGRGTGWAYALTILLGIYANLQSNLVCQFGKTYSENQRSRILRKYQLAYLTIDSCQYQLIPIISWRQLLDWVPFSSLDSVGAALLAITKYGGSVSYLDNHKQNHTNPVIKQEADSYIYFEGKGTSDLKTILPEILSFGPVLAVINNTDFSGYKKGILQPPSHDTEYSTSQFIIIVGYYRGSPDPNGSQTGATIKFLNTWGASWGDSGFGYLSEEWLKDPKSFGPLIALKPNNTISF